MGKKDEFSLPKSEKSSLYTRALNRVSVATTDPIQDQLDVYALVSNLVINNLPVVTIAHSDSSLLNTRQVEAFNAISLYLYLQESYDYKFAALFSLKYGNKMTIEYKQHTISGEKIELPELIEEYVHDFVNLLSQGQDNFDITQAVEKVKITSLDTLKKILNVNIKPKLFTNADAFSERLLKYSNCANAVMLISPEDKALVGEEGYAWDPIKPENKEYFYAQLHEFTDKIFKLLFLFSRTSQTAWVLANHSRQKDFVSPVGFFDNPIINAIIFGVQAGSFIDDFLPEKHSPLDLFLAQIISTAIIAHGLTQDARDMVTNLINASNLDDLWSEHITWQDKIEP